MSRGQSQPRTCSARTALRRCNSRRNNNTVIIDVDICKIDVIVVDDAESSNHRSRCSRNSNKTHFHSVIHIDDEGDDDDIPFRNSDHHNTSNKSFHPSSSNSYPFEEPDCDECRVLTGKGKSHTESPKWIFDTLSSECSTPVSHTSGRDASESENILGTEESESNSSDCEIMDDSSGDIREDWERAALKKKIEREDAGSKEGVDATSGATFTVQNTDNVHSHASTSVSRNDDILAASDIVSGFMEEPSHKLKQKNFVGDSDHKVSKGSHEKCDSKNKTKPLSGNALHGSHSQPEVSFGHEATASCSQNIAVPRPFSCDRCMQHELHDQVAEVSSMDGEDGERAFTTDLQDIPHNEDMWRCESPFPRNIPSPSKHMPDPQTGKAAGVAQDTPNFRPHFHCVFSEPHNSLNEQHTDMLRIHQTVSQGSLGNLLQEEVNSRLILQLNLGNIGMVSDTQNDIIGEWEKHKESEEYKHAEEEEWASRQREIQIQSEEAQKLRKRRKAENLRLLEMERRQKQRVEEIRESQKRNEETINLKERLRAEIRKELEKLEMKCRDMASLLRGLGINVGGGLYPLSREVNSAYKQALLRFHPDRASGADIRQQVEAEEKFKLISRLKEKLPLQHTEFFV